MAVKSRKVTIKGPRGEITKDFSHIPIEIKIMKMATKKMKGLYARIRMWNGGYKQACAVTTVKSLISNMIIGVTEVSSSYSSSVEFSTTRNHLQFLYLEPSLTPLILVCRFLSLICSFQYLKIKL